ncbi:MAG: hypothetical protein AMS22_05760 [Thiotrichales bacterium SG8_50]|nr:MAG: hypothetical protein AMS22_05760 [Thiotrichales bacterium SG8_50]
MNAKTTKRAKSTSTITLPRDAVDSIGSGAVRLNRRGDITYANEALCQILGVQSGKGLNLRDIFPDEKDFAEVSKNLKERFSERVGNDYCVEITRRSDGAKVPVNIIAVPETDEAGKVIGSFAFIRDLSEERKAHQIHKHIETERDWRRMLERVAEEVREIIPFDWLTISLYSVDLRHGRLLFSESSGEMPRWQVRWFELPEMGRRLMNEKRPIIIRDFEEFLSRPGWVETRKDSDTQRFLKMGYRSCLWYPVLEGTLVAGIALYKREIGAYRDGDQKIIEILPVRRAVSLALHYLDREERDFRLHLIRDIAASDKDSQETAQLLVDRIADHYEWENVSLFRVNEAQKRFELVAQKALAKDFEIAVGYTQELDAGILGLVYMTRNCVNSGNVNADPSLAARFKKGVRANVVSEVAIPIIVDGKVCAIFNSEHSLKNAYSTEEQQAVESVLREVSGLYKRIELQQILSGILQSTRDAIIRTDSKGVIVQTNRATTELLEFEERELVGTLLSQYFVNADEGKFFLEADEPPGDEVALRRKHGDSIAVLLSGSLLPDEVGGRVYTASDLTWRKRVERLEFLQKMYQEIGTLSHAPLSLCFSWIRKLLRASTGPDKEVLDKIIRQLKKVQLTFDRASLFEREGTSMPFNPVRLGVPYVLDGVVAEMPAEDRNHLDVAIESDLPPVEGDLFQLSFCLASVLGHLLQFVPEDGKVQVGAYRHNGNVEIKISGKTPRDETRELGRYGEESVLAHALFELAVGGDTLHEFMHKHAGRFVGPQRRGDEEEFVFVLPAGSSERI